jgi:hypothetical protein
MFPTTSDGTYNGSKVQVGENNDIKKEDVKAEKAIGNEKEECLDIKEEEHMYSEEDMEDNDIVTKEEEDVDVQEEVS